MQQSKDESPENEEISFERGGSNRNSIAERRRLYENRSATDGNLAEKASGSPTTIRRRDSFKSKSDLSKDEEPQPLKKSQPPSLLRQQSMDPRLESCGTPTPKRTSTVFVILQI